jgi:hypothetical protein
MNRWAAAFTASSFPAVAPVFGGSKTIDGEISTTSMMSSGAARPVQGVPIDVAQTIFLGGDSIGSVTTVADATTVSFPRVAPV